MKKYLKKYEKPKVLLACIICDVITASGFKDPHNTSIDNCVKDDFKVSRN